MDILNLINTNSKPTQSIDYNLQSYWKNYVTTVVTDDMVTIVDVDPGDIDPYIYNFYGLLHNIFNIPRDYWLPNLYINGYETSMDYLGDTRIKIINSEALEKALDFYKTLSKIKEK